jgi:hypothetical protein
MFMTKPFVRDHKLRLDLVENGAITADHFEALGEAHAADPELAASSHESWRPRVMDGSYRAWTTRQYGITE